jgi:TatD DNase family protein
VIDSHCHLADPAYAGDLEAVVHRAREAGVSSGVCILAFGDEAEARQAQRVRELWPEMHVSIGAHPHQAHLFDGRSDDVEGAVRDALVRTPGVKAIGEIGLDYHYDFSPRQVQRQVFATQIRLARELGRPVVVHTREADDDTVAIIRDEGGGEVTGIFHCFSGTESLARQALDLGFMLSFSGILTFPKAEPLRQIAAGVPADRLLVETDCPYLAPVPMRGKRNEPAWVVRTADVLAGIRHAPLSEIDRIVTGNLARLLDG